MNPTLSIILPVHNAQATLARDVHRLFEVADDLIPSLEILIVDNGSTDDTYETAHELAIRFPQIGVIRIADRVGMGPAVQRGIGYVQGATVIAHEGTGPVDPELLAEQWHRLNDEQVASATPADVSAQTPKKWLGRYLRWADAHSQMQHAHERITGFRVIRRASRSDAPARSQTGRGRSPATPVSLPHSSAASFFHSSSVHTD